MTKSHTTALAKLDKSHCLAPGLIRSLRKGERKTSKLNVTHEYGKDVSVNFSGAEPLGADDARVLVTITSLSGVQGMTLDENPDGENGKKLMGKYVWQWWKKSLCCSFRNIVSLM